MPYYNILFKPDDKTMAVKDTESILQALHRAGINIDASCGGKGICGRCKVSVTDGDVNTSQPVKAVMQEGDGYVLACQCFPRGNLIIEVPEESRLHQETFPDLVHSVMSVQGAANLSPVYKKIVLKLPDQDLNDAEDDLGRLLRTLKNTTGVRKVRPSLDALRQLPQAIRESGRQVIVDIAETRGYGEAEIISVLPYYPERNHAYGVAIDIGTTTVVARMLDLSSGKVIGTEGAYNKQAIYGEDVITRIVFSGEQRDGLKKLNKAVVDTINTLLEDLAGYHNIGLSEVGALVCAGNTTMIHLLLGIDPAHIRLEPYTPVANSFPAIRASSIGLRTAPGVWVNILPGVASYVGGDVVAGILATGMTTSKSLTLFIDIGTNGEMVLGNSEWLVACSCSAGPAFEGGGLRCGTRAVPGAIERVAISQDGACGHILTIGDKTPFGICGTGLISLLAGLFKTGLIDRAGKLIYPDKQGRVRKTAGDKEYTLLRSEDHGKGHDISISETEIINIIRSKAAVFAGIRSLLRMLGLRLENIDRVVIAGGFGHRLDFKDAVEIGLLPDIHLEKYMYAGNTSLSGAAMYLVNEGARRTVEDIAGKVTYLDLSTDNYFMDEFVSALFIPHTDRSLFPSL